MNQQSVLFQQKKLIYTAFGALLLAFCLIPFQSAFADVRKADVILGESVESRNLTITDCPSISAEYALLMDQNGTVYFERNAQDFTNIASITKIMTAIVALDSGIDLNSTITVSEKAATIGESTSDLKAGDTLSLQQALVAMLVSSGNDAAQAIAENLGPHFAQTGEDPYDAFIRAMNEKAQEIGMTRSLFENPHGLDYGIYAGDLHSTAYDVALMSKYAMQNETFRSIVSQSSAQITVVRDNQKTTIDLTSTDVMLDEYEGACGIKTGFTALAGASFSGACERDGKLLFAVVINSDNESFRFWDCEALFDWYFKHVVSYSLINTEHVLEVEDNGTTTKLPIVADLAHSSWIDKTIPVSLDASDTSIELFNLNGNVSQYFDFKTVDYNVSAGDVLGTLTFKQRNTTIAQYKLIAAQDCKAPGLFESISIWFQRLTNNSAQSTGVATTVIYNETPLVDNGSSLL